MAGACACAAACMPRGVACRADFGALFPFLYRGLLKGFCSLVARSVATLARRAGEAACGGLSCGGVVRCVEGGTTCCVLGRGAVRPVREPCAACGVVSDLVCAPCMRRVCHTVSASAQQQSTAGFLRGASTQNNTTPCSELCRRESYMYTAVTHTMRPRCGHIKLTPAHAFFSEFSDSFLCSGFETTSKAHQQARAQAQLPAPCACSTVGKPAPT